MRSTITDKYNKINKKKNNKLKNKHDRKQKYIKEKVRID